MNIKNKKTTGNICFFSFMKRLFICFLCIILCFNVVCKPKKTYAGTVGVAVAWGLADYLAALLASAGIALTVDAFCRGLGIYGGEEEVTEEEALQWCKNNITVDGDNNVVFTDDAKAFINDYLLGTYKDSVTMVYRYPLNKANIDASNFPNKIFLDTFISVMQAFPDCYFYVESDYRGNYDAYDRVSGVTSGAVWPNHYIINVVKSPFAGVNAYPDLVTTPVTLYNENWEVCKVAKFALCSSDNYATADNISYFSIDNIYYYNAYRRYDGTLYSSFDDFVNSDLSFVFGATDVSMCNKFSWNRTLTDFKTPYTVSDDPINVYKTVADMKKDIGSQVIGNYIPDYYTGTPNYNITTSEVNNIVNNYYPSDDSGGGSGSGSGSGSDDNGGGSGGGIFDDIISGISSGVGSIIKGIFSIIKDLVDAIADAIGSIVGTITDLMSLLNGNFTEFLSAVFPFMPSEFVTILVASVTLCMLGVIIKIFKG